MPTLLIEYKMNTASTSQIVEHFGGCNDSFIAVLSKKSDIVVYAKKISRHAARFEAWAADKLVGLVAAYFNDTSQKSSFITNVSTIKQYEGRGLASQLLASCIGYAEKQHYITISLQVAGENTTAIRLYSKYGFQQKSVENGELLMQKKLIPDI